MTSVTELTPKQVAMIKGRLLAGEYQHVIAADYSLNQGRVNEIAKGKRFPDVAPAKIRTVKRKA